MPAQKPQWFFQPRSHRNGAGTGDGDTAAGLTTVPAAMLRRHGARVLDPEKAAAVHGFPSPRSTVYRARTLLVPDGLIQDAPKVRVINKILDDVGMTLIPSRPEAPPRVRDPELARKLAQLPRVVTLAPARDNPVPAVVDAWVALQTLRAAVTRSGDRKPAKSPLDQDGRRADRAGAPAGRFGHRRQPGRSLRRRPHRQPEQQQRRHRAEQHRLIRIQRRRHAQPGRAPARPAAPPVGGRVPGRLRTAARGRRAGHGRTGSSVARCRTDVRQLQPGSGQQR